MPSGAWFFQVEKTRKFRLRPKGYGATKKERKMNGTLIYSLDNIPKVGDRVIVVVNGKNFPSGVWGGTLSEVDLKMTPEF